MNLQFSQVMRGLGQQLERFSQKRPDVLQRLPTPSNQRQIGMFAGSLLAYESWAQPKIPH